MHYENFTVAEALQCLMGEHTQMENNALYNCFAKFLIDEMSFMMLRSMLIFGRRNDKFLFSNQLVLKQI